MTRLLIDPAADFDDPGAVTLTATLLDPGPSIVRTFEGVTTDTVVDLPAPDTAEAWRLTIRRPVTIINRWNIASTNPGPIVAERTVRWTGTGPVAWASLTDIDPATLRTTAVPSAAWDAAIAELRAEVDALPTSGGGGGGFSGAYADLTGTPAIPSTPADIGAEPAGTADARIADLVDGAPDALNTLKELAAQLATDEGAAAGLAAAVAGKEPAGLSTSTRATLDGVYAPRLDPADIGFDVILLLGQSNMVGESGTAPDALVDVTDPRIWAYPSTGANAGRLVQAADPLAHQDHAAQVGPGMEFARWYAGIVPTIRRPLLVPAAYSGTAILAGTPRWDPTRPAGTDNLYSSAITRAQAALTAAGPGSRFVAALWVQGETDADNGITGADYRAALESIIDGLRDRLSVPELPFVIGSMLPEWIGTDPVRVAIDAAHQQIPTRKPYTAYVPGTPGHDRGDHIHYDSAGQRIRGRLLLDGLTAAAANSAPANAVPANPPAIPAPPSGSGRTAPAVNLTTTGTATYPAGKFGNGVDTSAAYFEGTGWGATARTLEFWAKTTSSALMVAFGDTRVSGSTWLGIMNGQVKLTTGGGVLTTGETINDGAWHHIAVTFAGGISQAGAATLYVDGQNSAGVLAGYAGDFGAAGGFGAFNPTAYFWQGVLDELRVSSTVRYPGTFTPPAAAFTPDVDTLGLYHFEASGVDAL